MKFIMYLTRVPRYKNLTAKEIKTIESYYLWDYDREMNENHKRVSFPQWCKDPNVILPDKYAIDYYNQFFTEKSISFDGVNEIKYYSIFEFLAKIEKGSMIYSWFVENIMNNTIDTKYHEVTEGKLKKLIDTMHANKQINFFRNVLYQTNLMESIISRKIDEDEPEEIKNKFNDVLENNQDNEIINE